MTCGERVINCLIGKPVDHVPYGVGIGWGPWGQTLERWRQETGNPELDPGADLGFEGSFAIPAFHAGLWPRFEAQVLEVTESHVIHRDAHGVTKRDRRDGLSMPEFLDYPVKCRADWDRLKAERLDPDAPGRIEQDWDAFRGRIAATGEAVQVGWFPYGIFGTPRDFMGVERLLLTFIDEPDLIVDMVEHLTTLWLSLWERVAAEVQIQHIHIWEDMSGRQGSLISPRMVERFMMPCYDRMVAFAREHRVPVVSVDTDGDCSQLLPVMTGHGINMFFPFEVQAGNDVREFRKLYPELGIMGGLDKRALAWGREEIDLEIQRAADMVVAGRYIPGFDHLIPPDVPWENYQYAAEQMRVVCGV